MSRRKKLVSTHQFAKEILRREDQKMWLKSLGRLALIWTTGEPVRPTVPTSLIFPKPTSYEVPDV